MSVRVFQGLVPTNFDLPVDTGITLATPTYPFTNVATTEAQSYYLRRPTSVIIEPTTEVDLLQFPVPYNWKTDVKIDSRQHTIAEIWNAFLYSKTSASAQFVTGKGSYLNFVNNPLAGGSASIATPTGTRRLGWKVTFTLDFKHRSLMLEGTNFMFNHEYNKFLTSMGGALTETGSTLTPNAPTTQVMNLPDDLQPGILDDGFQIGGVAIGNLKDFSMTLSTFGYMTAQGIEFSQGVDAKIVATTLAADTLTAQAAYDASQYFQVVHVNAATLDNAVPEQFIFTNCMRFTSKQVWDENEPLMQLTGTVRTTWPGITAGTGTMTFARVPY